LGRHRVLPICIVNKTKPCNIIQIEEQVNQLKRKDIQVMNYEDLKWINYSLFSHKDKSFDSHGYLDISVSINTSDDISFSYPKLVFNLDNQGQRRNVRLSYSNVVDLINSFRIVIKNREKVFSDRQTGGITKRYNSDKDLVIEFDVMTNTGQPVVIFKISHNYSDEGKIIFPFEPDFYTIEKILSKFEDRCDLYGIELPKKYLASLQLQKLNSVENLIKIIPTQLAPIQPAYIPRKESQDNFQDNTPDKGAPDVLSSPVPNGTRCSMCGEDQMLTPSGLTCKNGHGGADPIDEEQNEFEQFTAETVDSVRIPELESDSIEQTKPLEQTYQSPFITRVLKNNIYNLQEMIFALTTNNNPLVTIMDTIHNGQTYKLLPGISEQDLKSVFYLTNVYFKLNFQSHIQNQTIFPPGIPVIKYKGTGADRATIELSYDLLVIGAYLKLYRNRMEAIDSDPYKNGSLVHFAFRCFLDVATYSYLGDSNIEAVKNCVYSRFKSFREQGFFDFYDKNLASNRQQPINATEIMEYTDKVFNGVIDQDDVGKRHQMSYDTATTKLPPKNDFTPEQITNEIIKYEVKVSFGQRIEDLTSDENIILLFNTKVPKKIRQTDHRPEPRKIETHVLRYIKLKATEIPERFRNDFITYTEEMGSNQYDFNNSPFKIEELNDTSVKALYIWNNYLEDNIKYTDYVLKVEDCIDKDLIVAKVKETPGNTEEMDWSNTLGNIEL
jgi:hypothetical protein